MAVTMNPRMKAKWVRALRSGRYPQGRARLFGGRPPGDVGYCCLGVLAAEAAPEFTRLGVGGGVMSRGEVNECLIPDDLAIMWGLDRAAQHTLSEYNDKRRPFTWIADWIEASL